MSEYLPILRPRLDSLLARPELSNAPVNGEPDPRSWAGQLCIMTCMSYLNPSAHLLPGKSSEEGLCVFPSQYLAVLTDCLARQCLRQLLETQLSTGLSSLKPMLGVRQAVPRQVSLLRFAGTTGQKRWWIMGSYITLLNIQQDLHGISVFQIYRVSPTLR